MTNLLHEITKLTLEVDLAINALDFEISKLKELNLKIKEQLAIEGMKNNNPDLTPKN